MKRIVFSLILVIVFVPGLLGQKTYYVSSAGNDAADGLTKSTPWKTLGKINGTTFVPGDSILFRRGDVWRDQLLVHNSGNSSKYITYGAYGSGPNPKILGSIQATGFTTTAYANKWQSTATIPIDPWAISYFGEVFFEELNGKVSWGSRKTYTADLSNLTKEYDWTWNGNRIFVYAPADPDTRYFSVEAPQEAYCIQLENKNYIDINHIDMHYTSNACIYDEYATMYLTNLRVTYCNIGWVGTKDSPCAYGLDVHHSNSYYAYNEIHDCGRRNISLTMYDTDPITQQNVVIEHNYFHHGFHTTGVDCNNAGNHILEKITIRNNIFEGDPTQNFLGDNTTSNHVFIANQSPATGVTRNVYVYNNVFTYAHGKAIIFEDIDTAYAAYNTIYGFNLNLTVWQPLISTEYGSEVHIINNIIYHNGNEDVNGSLIGFFNNYSRVAVPKEIDYNLWYSVDPRASLLIFYQPYPNGYEDNYNMAAWAGLRSDYPGYEAHGPNPADPQFNNAAGGVFTLKATSPAIGKAKPIPWITTDYLGNPRSNVNPTIGAFEYNPGSNAFPVVNLTSPANGATYLAPASITLTATATDADGTITKVEFYSTTKSGRKTSSPYTFSGQMLLPEHIPYLL
ncbi:MAG: Ig-like domain-containing protein [Bacteroidales bacterium]